MAWSTRIVAGLAAALALAGSAAAQSYEGDWQGALEAGGQKLRLELHVKSEGGKLTSVLDSLDQGASIPANETKVENGELDAVFLPILGELKAKISADGQTITGTWSQGRDLPLVLTRKK